MTTPLFPILPYDPDIVTTKPETTTYLIAKDRAMMLRPFHFGHLLVSTPDIAILPEAPKEASLWLDFQKIPSTLIGQAWDFFAKVWDEYHAEAMVYVTYSADQGYRLFIPQQTTTGASVAADYNPEHLAKKNRIVGTIHSHCDFSAFHSSTDEADARNTDGMHMTIGHVNTVAPSTAVMISGSGRLWDFEFKDIIEGALDRVPSPDWWMRYVNDPQRIVTAPRTQITHSSPTTTTAYRKPNNSSSYRKPKSVPSYPGMSGYKPAWDSTCWSCESELPPDSESYYCMSCLMDSATGNKKSTSSYTRSFAPDAEALNLLADFVIRQNSVPKELLEDDLFENGISAMADLLSSLELALKATGITTKFTFSYDKPNDITRAENLLTAAIVNELPAEVENPTPF